MKKRMFARLDIMDWMYQYHPHTYIKTATVIRGLGFEDNEKTINEMRETLNELMYEGYIDRERRGSKVSKKGVFFWKLTEKGRLGRLPWHGSPQNTPEHDHQPEKVPDPYEEEMEAPEPSQEAEKVAIDHKEVEALYKRMELVEDINAALTRKVVSYEQQVKELREEVNATRVIEIKLPNKKTIKLEGVLPSCFDKVLDLAKCRMNILLVGPAGCGKTTIGELLAKALGLKFGAVQCTAGMSESHILGKELQNIGDGTSKFRGTDFVTCYEEGGVYLWDEFDAADPNVLLCVNSALSNNYVYLPSRPKRPRAERHPDFVCIATANTFGRGANRVYAGRNQLDEATIDRFRIGTVEVNYDRNIERILCPDDDLIQTLWSIRDKIEAAQPALRRVLSTRFIGDAYKMSHGADWKIGDILQALFVGWTEDERRKVGHSTPYKPGAI